MLDKEFLNCLICSLIRKLYERKTKEDPEEWSSLVGLFYFNDRCHIFLKGLDTLLDSYFKFKTGLLAVKLKFNPMQSQHKDIHHL